MDYRDILDINKTNGASWERAFDRFVSIEMMEAIGREYLEVYWSIVDRVLKEKDAVGVVQVITIPEARA